MAPPSASKPQIVIIKRKGGGGHAAHHGGAWKVAYADFVTAMMAFFLLLWLLNVTTQDQKKAIANYFDPTSSSESTSGSGGVLGGQSMLAPGAELTETRPIGTNIPEPGDPAAAWDKTVKQDSPQADANSNPHAAAGQSPTDSDKTKNAVADVEDKNFKEAEASIKQAIQSSPDLQAVAQNLMVDETPEGLRIQIVDQDGSSMFASGGSEMFEKTKKLMALVAQAVSKLPNQISVRGHTDSTPYHSAKGYNNWDLSTDRANASRRALIEGGLDPSRIANVVGKADKDPLFPENPSAPENRRISIVMLRASAANANTDALIAPAPPKGK
jgi:chemotaxis protein MotB